MLIAAGFAVLLTLVSLQTNQPPADPAMALLTKAQTLLDAGRYEEALVPLLEAQKLGTRPVMVSLRLAVAYAHLGNRDAAFRELMQTTARGLGALTPPFDTDAGLRSLRSDPRYAKFEEALDRNAQPCKYDAAYRQFDYWLGEWDVRPYGAPKNTPPASNVVTKIHKDCVILETWTTPAQTGQSFNIYDRVERKWHQTWVDSSGGLHEYWGELRDGNMVYEGDIPAPPGQGGGRVRTRLTFFRQPDGSVRQYSERTRDGGKTWEVNYDLIYAKR
jgi:tetratricopeptide (TPR) repeat protein